MIPIYEQGRGEGIGLSFDRLVGRFIEICREHVDNNRAKAFAILFYDFHDHGIRKILKSQGGFAQLDRLSGDELSVFYVHAGDRNLLRDFNEVFRQAFEIDYNKWKTPFVLFFKISENEVTDVQVVELQQSNLIFAFKELYDIIENFISRLSRKDAKQSSASRHKMINVWVITRKLAVETFIKHLIEKGIEDGGPHFRNFG